MTDRIEKALDRLSGKERKALEEILGRIKRGNFAGLDMKKLAGRDDIFRVRKGSMRILFRRTAFGITVLAVERRSDTTYS
jgi:mRNA-degrading endonuclease RelE of RelBE toxin-antitoxin system